MTDYDPYRGAIGYGNSSNARLAEAARMLDEGDALDNFGGRIGPSNLPPSGSRPGTGYMGLNQAARSQYTASEYDGHSDVGSEAGGRRR